ncbi:hypothetical protein BY458DRAFT_508757 [Sporodiniella umbellata]|nr:hypothetical protein BY458DRAFT_508757 [Sporodiniella umbellata]
MTSIRHHFFEKLKRFFADNLKEKQLDMRKIMLKNNAAERRLFESLSHTKQGGKIEHYLCHTHIATRKSSLATAQ